MNSTPFVSVVVCAFNEEKILRQCLDALVSQTYPAERYEIQVIDDESTDQTFSIAEEFIISRKGCLPYIRLTRIRHGGLSVARNAGIRLSRGEIIAFIDGDAVPDRKWLEELVKPFLEGADYVGGRIDLLNTDSWFAVFLQRTRNRQFFGPRIFNDQCIGCNMAFRREIFETVGGFHENFVSRGDDSTLQARIRPHYKYAPASGAIVLHERPDTILKSIRTEWKSATLATLCAKAAGVGLTLKSALLITEQSLMTIFPLLLICSWVAPEIFLFPLVISISASIRRLYLRPLNREIAKGLINEYGWLRGSVGHLLFVYFYNMLSFFGRLLSPWLYRNEPIVPPFTTPLSILKSVDNFERNNGL